MRTAAVVIFVISVGARPVFALDQSAHESISHDACIAAGLPQDFCERVGTEAYNVDSYEWRKPEAHAQIADGESACTWANAALARERQLGSDLRASLFQLAQRSSEDLRIHIATQLGRALHTIQDDCAHHGMPNQQHAWWSVLDSCTGSKTSPDAQPEAVSCARTETAAVLVAFTDEMAAAGIDAPALDDLSEGWTHWPTRGDVCAFLHDAETWDGTDHRWDNALVVPWLRDQLTNALTVDDSSIGDACTVDLSVPDPRPTEDLSKRPNFCFKLKAFCFGAGGKEDADEVPPPWEANAPSSPKSAGCSVAGDHAALWLVVALALAIRRRRAAPMR